MTRLGVTFAQVELAAEKILQEGNNPTIERVRSMLGGTGSNTTISKYLNDWRSLRLTATSTNLPNPHIPPDPVNAAVNQVWRQIREEAQAEITACQDKAKADLEEMGKNYQEAIQERDFHITQYSNLQEQCHQITAEKELLQLDFNALKEEHQLLQENKKSLQKRFAILEERSAAHIKDLKATREEDREDHQKQLIDLKKAHESTLSELKQLNESYRQDNLVILDKYKISEQKKEKTIEQLTTKIQQLNEELIKEQLLAREALQSKDTLQKELTQKNKTLSEQSALLDKLKNRLDSHEKYHINTAEQIKNIYQTIIEQQDSNKHIHSLFHFMVNLLLPNAEDIKEAS